MEQCQSPLIEEICRLSSEYEMLSPDGKRPNYMRIPTERFQEFYEFAKIVPSVRDRLQVHEGTTSWVFQFMGMKTTFANINHIMVWRVDSDFE